MEREIKAHPDIGANRLNVELFYETLVKIIEDKCDVKIKYTVRQKTPEEKAKDPHKMVEVSDNVRMQIQQWESGM